MDEDIFPRLQKLKTKQAFKDISKEWLGSAKDIYNSIKASRLLSYREEFARRQLRRQLLGLDPNNYLMDLLKNEYDELGEKLGIQDDTKYADAALTSLASFANLFSNPAILRYLQQNISNSNSTSTGTSTGYAPVSPTSVSAAKNGGILKYLFGGGANLLKLRSAFVDSKKAYAGTRGSGKYGNVAGLNGVLEALGIDGGTVGDSVTAAITTPEEKGQYGGTTKAMNGAYDSALKALKNVPVWGEFASALMGGLKAAGQAMSKAGLGTDGVTKGDAFLGSNFTSWNIGAINGALGKNTHELLNIEDEANVMYGADSINGYQGSLDEINKLMKYSDKKIGGFFPRKRNQYNDAIDRLNELQDGIRSIAKAASSAFDIQENMASINENRTAMDLEGGYDLSVHVGRLGMKINQLPFKYDFSKAFDYDFDVLFAKKGTSLKQDSTLKNKKESDPDVPVVPPEYTAFATLVMDSPANWVLRLINGNEKIIPNWEDPENSISSHKLGWANDKLKGTVIFPFIQELDGELHDFTDPKYNHDKWDALDSAIEHNDYVIAPSAEIADWYTNDNYKRYFPSTQQYIRFQFGGPIDDVEKFKLGGLMNVIPEGNLHARLHHMEDADGLTKKGIPVVDNDGEQLAEIELNEIIFNKDVTTKLEEYWKDGSDEAAIKAGKLLAEEIIEHTDDRTGLIDTI